MIKGSAIRFSGKFEDWAKAAAYQKNLNEFLDETFNLSNRIERERFVWVFRCDNRVLCVIYTSNFLECYQEASLKQLLDILYDELVKGNIKEVIDNG